jgi:transcription initiation factor TFIIB
MFAEEMTLRDLDSQCRECHAKLVTDLCTGEMICTACGVVNKIQEWDQSANFASYASELGSTMDESPSAMTYDMSLPAKMGESDIDASGKHIQATGDLNRLRRLDEMTNAGDSRMRNLAKAAKEIQRLTRALGVGKSIAERAYELYRKGLGHNGSRGKSILGMAGAAVYLACRELEVPRSSEEIEHLAETVDRKNIKHYSKILMRETKLNVAAPDPSFQVSRIASRAGLSGTTERRSVLILSQIKDEAVLAGKRPVSIAAAALYLASSQTNEYVTQIQVAFAAGITTITLRNRTLEISKLLEGQKAASSTPVIEVAP